jgi:hypothetical protein
LPAASPMIDYLGGGYMRSIALDVDRDFCEVAIKEEGGSLSTTCRSSPSTT